TAANNEIEPLTLSVSREGNCMPRIAGTDLERVKTHLRKAQVEVSGRPFLLFIRCCSNPVKRLPSPIRSLETNIGFIQPQYPGGNRIQMAILRLSSRAIRLFGRLWRRAFCESQAPRP